MFKINKIKLNISLNKKSRKKHNFNKNFISKYFKATHNAN